MTKPINGSIPELQPLKDEESLIDWDQQLYQTLVVHDLEQYIERDIPEPPEKDEDRRKVWKKDRATVVLIITSSLTTATKQTLDNQGWNRREKNPFTLYTLIKKAVPRQSTRELIVELGSLALAKFDSISALQNRAQYLKRRLTELQVNADDRFYLWFVLHAMETAYPDEYRFLVRDLEKEDLKWDNLMIKLSSMAAKENKRKEKEI